MNALYHHLIEPIQTDADVSRREPVLNIILVVLCGVAVIISLLSLAGLLLDHIAHESSSILSSSLFIVAVYGLLWMSRRGYARIAAFALVVLLGLTVTVLTILWSFKLPIAELLYALTIVTAGVVLDTRAALVMTISVSLMVFGVSVAEVSHMLYARTDWADQPFVLGDAITYLAIFSLIGLIAWLGNRQIDRSLQLAQTSQHALLAQRDKLEIMVTERTKQLEKEQHSRLLEIQRFAEFGRISASLIHDVANPLTAISLNLDQLQNKSQSALLTKARDGLKYLERYLNAARKQLKAQASASVFSVNDELQQVISILSSKAAESFVHLEVQKMPSLTLYGDAVKFSQLVANLVGNAIEAYPSGTHITSKRSVIIDVTPAQKGIILHVTDQGNGVAQKDQAVIFDPFYTTKATRGRGIGIGLAIVKEYVEVDFNGHISVQSSAQGTTFIVLLKGAVL